ncbi:MAG: hypothetical protein KJ060_22525, partial [Candidatus Hydrogenedentes bacterium]|nr:hypothetical protein [Candidatus Hydrogenedentota bacterium]
TEEVGKALAAITMEVAEEISCNEAQLHVAYSTPALPPTIAASLMPDQTYLQTLEIDNLLLTFFPGEPCVEIGLEMRRQARSRGYANQFSVGLANDHILYFVHNYLYGTLVFESAMNMYGPHIDRWFYSEFGKLMTKGSPAETPPSPGAAELTSLDSMQSIRLEGDAYTRGYQRGVAFREDLGRAYQDYVVSPCRSGEWIPNGGLWSLAPPFVDQTPLALTRLAIGARPMLAGLAPGWLDEISGMADGAQLPFDAVWLTQCAATYTARASKDEMYRSPFCSMVAVTGDKAGADDCVVGRNFDWPDQESPVIADTRPSDGRRYVTVGFPWSAGTFTGMNEAGVVIAVERVENRGEPSIDVPPIEIVLAEVLRSSSDPQSAIEAIEANAATRGYHILVAGPTGADARVLELGASVVAREAVDGVLLGIDPASSAADGDAAIRYARMSELVSTERIVSEAEMRSFLDDREPGREGQAAIRNEMTRYSVVFEPKARALHVATFATSDAEARYTTISLVVEAAP